MKRMEKKLKLWLLLMISLVDIVIIVSQEELPRTL
jgi:hypothetical protein